MAKGIIAAVLSLLCILSTPSLALASEFSCKPYEVSVWNNRVHIRCTTSVKDGADTIWYWAVPATDAERANRFVSLGSTALVAGRSIYFGWTAGDKSGASFGCLAKDCRTPTSFALR